MNKYERKNYYIFASMDSIKKRHIASWVLLVVFVPMLLISSLHIHESVADSEYSCMECVHHVCHGHLTQQSAHLHDCVLCQFLTLTFVAALIYLFYYYQPRNTNFHLQRCFAIHAASRNLIIPRAPPYV